MKTAIVIGSATTAVTSNALDGQSLLARFPFEFLALSYGDILTATASLIAIAVGIKALMKK